MKLWHWNVWNFEDERVRIGYGSVVEEAKNKAKKLASVNASKKAIAYAEEKGVDITLIQKDGIIKTQDIDEWIANHK